MKRALYILASAVVIVIAWYFIYTHPTRVHKTLSGLQFHVGEPTSNVKPVTIQVDGTLKRSVKGIWTYRGIIELLGTTQPNSDNHLPLTIRFLSDGTDGMLGAMDYQGINHGTPYLHAYGSIFTNPNFTKLVILEARHGWTSPGGLTIAAPASNRPQAVSISNVLMKGWFGNYSVK